MSRRPKRSSPTFPIIAVEQPYFCNAARKLQGAPPGWAFSVGYPAASAVTGAKSMSISPRATMVGMRKPLSILHSSTYANDCASQERPRRLFRPVLFFAMILPALQGSVAASAVRCSMERMIPSSVLPLSWSSSFFTAKLLVPVRQMMHPRQLRLARILFKFPGGILVRTRCGGKTPAAGRQSAPLG